jgi:ABC-type multidrug transport system permease subunit
MADREKRNPLVQLTLTRIREMTREPGIMFWIFGFPILISVGLGLAFRTRGPEPGVVGALPGAPGDVIAALERGGVKVQRLDEAASRLALRSGKVALVVVPPERAGGPVGYRFDPTRSETRLARATVDDLVQRAAGRRDPRVVQDQLVQARGARYIDFLIPGLIGMNLMSGSMWGIGWVIVNMRVRKLLKRLMAAPMRRSHLLIAQGLARLLLIPVEVATILVFARLAFDVRLSGSLLALAVICLAGAGSFAAVAVLVASRAQNNETVSGLMNLVMMPMFVVSGVFFSSSHFPEVMQPLIGALPLTALNDGLRAVIVDGAGLTTLGGPLLVLGIWGAISFALGLRLFRWS